MSWTRMLCELPFLVVACTGSVIALVIVVGVARIKNKDDDEKTIGGIAWAVLVLCIFSLVVYALMRAGVI